MHHIFIAHSFTTYLTGRLVAIRLQLDKSEQTIIATRNFTPNPSDLDITVSIPLKVIPEPFPLTLNLIRNRRNMQNFLKESLSRSGKSPFTLYSHDCCTNYVQLLANAPKCKELCLLEEGSAAYLAYDALLKLHYRKHSLIEKVASILSYGNRIRTVGFAGTEKRIFSLGPTSFPGTASTVVFNRSEAQRISREQGNDIPNNSTILILDASPEFFVCSLNSYMEEIRDILSHHPISQKLFYKFHMSQSLETKLATIRLLEELKITGSEIAQNTPIERYIFSDSSHTFLGIRSSCLLYARQHGSHTVYSTTHT